MEPTACRRHERLVFFYGVEAREFFSRSVILRNLSLIGGQGRGISSSFFPIVVMSSSFGFRFPGSEVLWKNTELAFSSIQTIVRLTRSQSLRSSNSSIPDTGSQSAIPGNCGVFPLVFPFSFFGYRTGKIPFHSRPYFTLMIVFLFFFASDEISRVER